MDLPQSIITFLEEKFNGKVTALQSVQGGDINKSYKFSVDNLDNEYFLKLNLSDKHKDIILSEVKALAVFKEYEIPCPLVFFYNSDRTSSFIVMEFVTGNKYWSKHTVQSFVSTLVKLHSVNNESYGWHESNCIGSLPQYNDFYNTFIEYYWHSRIEVQIRTAYDNGYLKNKESYDYLIERFGIIPTDKPSLIHGDLWSGNYLINLSEESLLIDPSCSYGHREMDLAMMGLFGGFPNEVYEIYNEQLPLNGGWQSRTDLFQLYYLLVHLNIFGRGYLHSVNRILKKYK